MSGQQHCVTCSKKGGILTCNGCLRTFCGKHVIEHRQELTNQLDGIMQEHDLLQQDFTRTSDQHLLLEKINKWEQTSITKIQVVAEAARADLRQIIENSKEGLTKSCRDIAESLRSSREADDFSEIDLTRWMQQLEELKLEVSSPSAVQIIESEQSVIPLITIQNCDSAKKAVRKNKNSSSLNYPLTSDTLERFSNVTGLGEIHEEGLLAIQRGDNVPFACFLGQQCYSRDRRTVRFIIEQSKTPYNIFFGCVSSQMIIDEISYTSLFLAGWFGYNEVYQHGSVNANSKDHGYRSDEIKTNDVLQLSFDCGKRQIELFQERTNIRHTLAVDINKAPFPWQLLLILTWENDRVRILS